MIISKRLIITCLRRFPLMLKLVKDTLSLHPEMLENISGLSLRSIGWWPLLDGCEVITKHLPIELIRYIANGHFDVSLSEEFFDLFLSESHRQDKNLHAKIITSEKFQSELQRHQLREGDSELKEISVDQQIQRLQLAGVGV